MLDSSRMRVEALEREVDIFSTPSVSFSEWILLVGRLEENKDGK